MPPSDIDDLIDPCFNRFMQSVRFTFLSGVFGFILTISSFLAIPFAATLPYYNTAIIVCVFIGIAFLTMFCYCCRAWWRLRLGDFLYRYRQPQRIPRFDLSNFDNIGNEDTLDDSKYLPSEDSGLLRKAPSQSYGSCGAYSETNPVGASARSAICTTYAEETLPSTAADANSQPKLNEFLQPCADMLSEDIKEGTKGKNDREISSDLEKDPGTIIFSSIDSKVHYKTHAFNATDDTFLTTASMPNMSEVRVPVPAPDESSSCESETRSISSVISNIIVNLPILNKILNESSSGPSSIENGTPEYKKEASSSSVSLVDSDIEKTKGTDSSILDQQLSSKSTEMKRSRARSEKDTSSISTAHYVVEVHDSSRSRKSAAADLRKRASVLQEYTERTETSTVQEEHHSSQDPTLNL